MVLVEKFFLAVVLLQVAMGTPGAKNHVLKLASFKLYCIEKNPTKLFHQH